MKFAALPAAVLAIAAATGCSAAPANPLLGDWISTVAPDATGAAGCSTRLTFTKETRVNYWKGQSSMELVTYNVQQGEVFIIQSSGGSIGYKMLTADTMLLDAGYLNCTYKRA